jgi:hypothetical protein
MGARRRARLAGGRVIVRPGVGLCFWGGSGARQYDRLMHSVMPSANHSSIAIGRRVVVAVACFICYHQGKRIKEI